MGSFFEWMIESSLLVMMIMGIRKIFMGKIRYSRIYALWFVVLLRFMIPVNFVSTPFSVGNLIPSIESTQGVQEGTDVSSQEENWEQEPQTGQNFNTVSLGHMPTADESMKSSKVQKTSGLSRGQIEEIETVEKESGQTDGINGKLVMKYGRLVVSAVLFVWFVLSNLFLIWKLRQDRTLYGQRGSVKIYAASGIQSPCLYGFFRPSIYIPKMLVSAESDMRVDEGDLAQIITHEYVHYRHRDHIWAMFRMLLVSLYWFDPFLWLAVSCAKKDAELFCDETVIQCLGEERRLSYGKMLVRLAKKASWGEFRYPIMAMSKRGKEMEQRIRAISRKRCYSKWVVVPLVVIVLAAAGITCSSGIRTLAGEGSSSGRVSGDRSVNAVLNEQIFSENSVFDAYAGEVGTTSDASEAAGALLPIHKRSVEKAFKQYVGAFTEAVNTGDVNELSQVLDEGSAVYEQQCRMAKNYYGRGIREEVLDCSVSSANTVSATQVVLCSDEKIQVSYADATTKVVKQRYQYTCEYINQKWIITNMEEVM